MHDHYTVKLFQYCIKIEVFFLVQIQDGAIKKRTVLVCFVLFLITFILTVAHGCVVCVFVTVFFFLAS
jgi:hypothetical protein